jgi:hypothetical protein
MNTIKTILIAILFPISSFAQLKYKITKCDSHLKMGKEWVLFQENYPTTMFFYVDSVSFKINNEDHSVYKIISDSTIHHYPEFTTYTWDGYDKNNQDCQIVITELLNDDCTFYFSVFYEAKCYNWMLKEID